MNEEIFLKIIDNYKIRLTFGLVQALPGKGEPI
jgi:hypothetical protein